MHSQRDSWVSFLLFSLYTSCLDGILVPVRRGGCIISHGMNMFSLFLFSQAGVDAILDIESFHRLEWGQCLDCFFLNPWTIEG